MSVFQSLMLMIAFGGLVVSIVTLAQRQK
ncbi:putative holin-like toxin [Bacillus sp. FSL W7-1360]